MTRQGFSVQAPRPGAAATRVSPPASRDSAPPSLPFVAHLELARVAEAGADRECPPRFRPFVAWPRVASPLSGDEVGAALPSGPRTRRHVNRPTSNPPSGGSGHRGEPLPSRPRSVEHGRWTPAWKQKGKRWISRSSRSSCLRSPNPVLGPTIFTRAVGGSLGEASPPCPRPHSEAAATLLAPPSCRSRSIRASSVLLRVARPVRGARVSRSVLDPRLGHPLGLRAQGKRSCHGATSGRQHDRDAENRPRSGQKYPVTADRPRSRVT